MKTHAEFATYLHFNLYYTLTMNAPTDPGNIYKVVGENYPLNFNLRYAKLLNIFKERRYTFMIKMQQSKLFIVHVPPILPMH